MSVTEGRMVAAKAVLYFLIAQLTPLAALLATAADANTQAWPAPLQIVSCLVTGFIAGLIALRAFFDGSNDRYEQTKRNGSAPKEVKPA